MARKNKKAVSDVVGETELCKALREGSPIAGMVGHVPFTGKCCSDNEDAEVYIKVRVVGFNTENCGVAVEVEPISGVGRFSIEPCNWVDKPGDIENIREQTRLSNLADEDAKQITGSNYTRNRKGNLLAYVTSHLSEGQQAEFYGQVEEMKSGVDLKGLSDQDVRWLAAVVTRQVHGVLGKVGNDQYRY